MGRGAEGLRQNNFAVLYHFFNSILLGCYDVSNYIKLYTLGSTLWFTLEGATTHICGVCVCVCVCVCVLECGYVGVRECEGGGGRGRGRERKNVSSGLSEQEHRFGRKMVITRVPPQFLNVLL